YDIIKLAREYLRSPEGKKDKRRYLRHRPSYVKDQVEAVYEMAKDLIGKVFDPSGVELSWDPTKPRNGQWDMGHIPGQRYAVVHAKYVLGMMTTEEFLQWYRDPKNYRPELPSTNRGHKHE
ncbi:MAG: HNH/ENDO VII family nuclease, partial [Clostridia bacterium]|nr:HNH/ENDO VII family nuclease [Clostridia bacterium]